MLSCVERGKTIFLEKLKNCYVPNSHSVRLPSTLPIMVSNDNLGFSMTLLHYMIHYLTYLVHIWCSYQSHPEYQPINKDRGLSNSVDFWFCALFHFSCYTPAEDSCAHRDVFLIMLLLPLYRRRPCSRGIIVIDAKHNTGCSCGLARHAYQRPGRGQYCMPLYMQ